MFWFNVIAGTASILGLVIAVWTLVVARSVRSALDDFGAEVARSALLPSIVRSIKASANKLDIARAGQEDYNVELADILTNLEADLQQLQRHSRDFDTAQITEACSAINKLLAELKSGKVRRREINDLKTIVLPRVTKAWDRHQKASSIHPSLGRKK